MRLVKLMIALALGAAGAVVATPANAEFDVYTTPGTHTINGRQWRTACEDYSSTVERCRTEIWAYTVDYAGGRFTEKAGWAFNNLTYKKSNRATWADWNPLVTPGEHVVDSRRWTTECDTKWTGRNGCRSMIYATVSEKTDAGFRVVNKFVFNNIVHLAPVACDVSQAKLRTDTGESAAIVHRCERSAKANTWLAVDYAVPHSSGEGHIATAFYRQSSGKWLLKAETGVGATALCDWAKAMNVPSDLEDHIQYCGS